MLICTLKVSVVTVIFLPTGAFGCAAGVVAIGGCACGTGGIGTAAPAAVATAGGATG